MMIAQTLATRRIPMRATGAATGPEMTPISPGSWPRGRTCPKQSESASSQWPKLRRRRKDAMASDNALEAAQAAPAIDLPGDPASNADAAQALHASAWSGLPAPIRRAMLALIAAADDPH